jgi:hypothetical protein
MPSSARKAQPWQSAPRKVTKTQPKWLPTLGIRFAEPPSHLHVDENSKEHCIYPEIKLAAQ